MIDVRHDAAARRFIAEVEGRQAVLDYTIHGDVMTITHTGVPPAIGGRGIAGELVRAALDTARNAGWRVIPICSFAAAYMARHSKDEDRRHQEDLLDEALDESFPASDPPSVGRSS
ncbi:MAG TPA: GNAT family N-acetyltransferase [Steroidobacteraceae bacterium]|nr:GNAT family N-acetyltransferase [Steroidobacteraceae bacterium]